MDRPATPPVKVPADLQDDSRHVSDLWKQALQNYKGIAGFDLERKFGSLAEMVDFGTEQMNNFHKFRHDGKKVDRLRGVFMGNLGLLEKGTQQLTSAAVAAFPPAAAIGTAMTFVLQASRAQSADYDVINAFFDDMNSFLQRIVILETRLPSHRAYQNCLMEVFTSFLSMCGFAYKYIKAGRFKKWLANLLEGQDSELADARDSVVHTLARLQNATEFAILGNTEETKKMTRELRENSAAHTRMLQEQRQLLGSIQETAENTHSDVQKILNLMKLQGMDKAGKGPSRTPDASKPPSAARARSAMLTVDADTHEYTVLKETMAPNTGAWLFTEASWASWLKRPVGERPTLVISGPPGTGKSHLALATYEKLAELASDDTDGETVVAHFYFRNQQLSFRYFLCGIITVINQVAEQNARMCEQINAEMFQDEVMINHGRWEELVDHVLAPVFRPESRNHLLLLFDGLDELANEPDESFVKFAEMVAEKKSRISVVATCRTSYLANLPESAQALAIEVTKQKQLIDLRALAWDRIKKLDNLRRLSPYVQQRVADTIVEASPNLLYAEHMLARLSALGREGAVLEVLRSPKPNSLQGIYQLLLGECARRMIPAHQEIAAMLMHWMAFSAEDMTLGSVESLLQYLADDEAFGLEEIPEFVSRFLLIGDPVDRAMRMTSQSGVYTVSDVERGQEDHLYHDDDLLVRFQERSMMDFFRESKDQDTPFRWRASEAHRRIFLASAGICLQGAAGSIKPKLRDHAADEIFIHWRGIDIETHTAAQQVEVMEALAEALSYPGGLGHVFGGLDGLTYTDDEAPNATDGERIAKWTALLDKDDVGPQLSPEAREWHKQLREDPRRLRLGIAKGFVHLLYQTENREDAVKQFMNAKNCLGKCQLQTLLSDNATKRYPEDSVMEDGKPTLGTLALGIVNLFDEVPMDDCAYRASAEVVSDYFPEIGIQLCQTALRLNAAGGTVTQRCKILILMAQVLAESDKPEDAQQAIESCLPHVQDETVSVAIKQLVWVNKARIEIRLGLFSEAEASHREARAVDPATMLQGYVLVEELELYQKRDDKTGYMSTFSSFSPLERLTWLAWDYPLNGADRQAYLLDCATVTGQGDFIVSVYRETIGHLDNINASAPLKVDIAVVYQQVMRDVGAARQVLDQVFDTPSNGWAWAITSEDPQVTLLRALPLMTDTIFTQFYQSRDPKVKMEAYHALQGLPARTFTLAIPAYSPLVWTHYRICLAVMSLKLGQATEFQSTLQAVIDVCLDAVNDKVGWNDSINLMELGHALAVMGKTIREPNVSAQLLRCARIAVSATFSDLDPDLDDEMSQRLAEQVKERVMVEEERSDAGIFDQEGDLMPARLCNCTCDGACRPTRIYAYWGKRTAYYCVTCAVTLLCEPCYAKVRALARDEDRVPDTRYYCGSHHEYLKLPIEGWQGVRSGLLRIEGEEPMPVKDFFEQLRATVKEGWDEFWSGA